MKVSRIRKAVAATIGPTVGIATALVYRRYGIDLGPWHDDISYLIGSTVGGAVIGAITYWVPNAVEHDEEGEP